MTETSAGIEALLLTVDGELLLLPSAAWIEAVGAAHLTPPPAAAPVASLGTLDYRGSVLPVFSFADLAGGEARTVVGRMQIAILRVPDAERSAGLIGLRCFGAPHRLVLRAGMLQPQALVPGQRLRLARARLGALSCAIPDLEELARQAQTALETGPIERDRGA